jgi:hypothetical protein
MKRRPLLVTCLSLVVLIFSAVQFVSLRDWTNLLPVQMTIPDWYLPVRSVIWGLSAAAAAIGLFFGYSWSLLFTRGSIVVYFLWYWADRLLLRNSDFARQAFWFYGALQLLACILVLWVLSRRSTQAFLRSFSDE